MRAALTRYRALAYVTGVFLLLLTLHLLLKWQQSSSAGIPYADAGGIGRWVPLAHGWLYLAYVIVAVDLWFRARLPIGRTVLVVLAGTIPFMSFVAERWVTSRVAPLVEAAERAPTAERTASTG